MRAKTATQLLVGNAARILPTPRRTSALLAVLLCALLPHSAFSAAIVQYDFSVGTTTASTSGTAVSATSIVAPPNSTLTALTAGAGYVGGSDPLFHTGISTAATGGNPQPGLFVRSAATAATSDASIAANQYYTFTLTPDAGFQLNLTSITIDVGRSGAGTSPSFFVRSSINSFATNLGLITIPGATGDGVTSSLTADLSGAAFQNLTSPIEFRFGAVDTSSSTSDVNRFDNVILNGAVAAVPEPSTWAMLLGGVGMLSFWQRSRRKSSS